VRAPREAVYRALTTAEGHDQWFTRGTEIVPEPGGVMHLRWRDWGAATVELDFVEDERGTLVSVRESGYVDDEEGHDRYP